MRYHQSKKSKIGVLLLIVAMVSTMALAGCSNEETNVEEPPADTDEVTATDENETQETDDMEIQEKINLAMVSWTCSTQKNYIHAEVLQTLGYDVDLQSYALPVILEGLSDGQIDVFADAWWVTWGTPLQEAVEEGRVIHLDTHLENVNYAPAVPVYVYEAGVTSLADLAEHADAFDHTYYGLEPGNDGNEIMLDAFADNIYGLGDWEMLESNEAAMITEVGLAIENEEWVVFSGWEPHYMNVIFDMEYLDDPEGIWGEEAEFVATLSRPGLEEERPNFARYMKQFKIEIEDVNEWVYAFGYEDRDPEEYAAEWVSENIDIVLTWVDGVKTVDGRDASEAIKDAYQ
ncbi:glycine betaine/proline transport system substrate-binding protein [Tindallia magadiensis]|uniref:Glycine betaine/proline transport system substrate-binding protein n=1 Tax=Tindallia magadiensis TaxID=69895 RepID=A0A1I3EMG0_9FIRM|nr:ABC transporter substrate-binding protein [Tindallia magadiensis]SFI00166.1 glycine betaine/proline transport system substrate-binding protein [Tindallia magadiensis]